MIQPSVHSIARHATPLGSMWSQWTDRGLYRLDWTDPESDEHVSSSFQRQVDALEELLQSFYVDGTTLFDSVVIDPTGWTEYSEKIYDRCRIIPAGETLTYQELAGLAGNANASRAAGAAMARNRVVLVIPCHRVVSSDGHLRGFSAPGGLTTKRALLDLERLGHWPAETAAGV